MGLVERSLTWSPSVNLDDFLLLYDAGAYLKCMRQGSAFLLFYVLFLLSVQGAITAEARCMPENWECLWKAVSWTLPRKPLVPMTLQLGKSQSTRRHSRLEEKLKKHGFQTREESVFKQNCFVDFYFFLTVAELAQRCNTGWNKLITALLHPNPQK